MSKTQRPKAVRHPPSYYVKLRERLAAQGLTPRLSAPNTTKGKQSLLRKVKRYCDEHGIDQLAFMKESQAADWKTFWQWTLDNYKVNTRSSLQQYSRRLAEIIHDDTGHELDGSLRRDVSNYLKHLQNQYRLRKYPKQKPLITGLDDLYHLLYTLWALDGSVFKDEHQRTMLATGILAGVYFGVRLVSLFDTRVKVDDLGDNAAASWSAIIPEISHAGRGEPGSPGGDRSRDENSKSFRRTQSTVADDFVSRPDRKSRKSQVSTTDVDIGGGNGSANSESNSDSDTDGSDGFDRISDGDSDTDVDDCTDAGSIADSDFDDDSCTDDDYDAGDEETGAFLYRHFTIFLVPNATPGKPNTIFMKATLLHTKGEDNNPRIKTITIDSDEDDLMFSLVDHLISLALHDDAFEAESAKAVENLFWVKITEGKECMELKWRRSALDKPIFRQPLRGGYSVGTSPSEPLRAGTWASYLTRLGKVAGFKHPLTQYWLRRGLVNTVNSRAPSSVRDQLFDHKIGAVRFYLDQEIRCDTKACFLGRPSNEIVQKMARCAKLTVDLNAPMRLSEEQKAKLRNHSKLVTLNKRNRAITAKLHAKGYKPIRTAAGTPLYAKKKRAEARLNSARIRIRDKMLRRSRKRHYRSADTRAFDAQFCGSTTSKMESKPLRPSRPAAIEFDIPERAELVQLTCNPSTDMSDVENLARRIRVMKIRATLCSRQEAPRRGPPGTNTEREDSGDSGESDDSHDPGKPDDPDDSDDQDDPDDPESDDEESIQNENIPLVCKPTQCTFCLGNERLPYRHRVFRYSRRSKMMDHVDKTHLSRIGLADAIECRHPVCRSQNVVLPSVMVFKSHTAKVHGIYLRA